MGTSIAKWALSALLVLTTALVCFGLFYLTPLRYVNIVEPTMKEVDPAVFEQMYTEHPDQYLFIDVRSESEYAKLHAAGSSNTPIAHFFDDRHTLPKTGKTIVLICSGGKESAVAYGYLEHFGFRNLLHVDGGLQAWTRMGLPTEGAAAIPLSST